MSRHLWMIVSKMVSDTKLSKMTTKCVCCFPDWVGYYKNTAAAAAAAERTLIVGPEACVRCSIEYISVSKAQEAYLCCHFFSALTAAAAYPGGRSTEAASWLFLSLSHSLRLL